MFLLVHAELHFVLLIRHLDVEAAFFAVAHPENEYGPLRLRVHLVVIMVIVPNEIRFAELLLVFVQYESVVSMLNV